MAGPDVLLLMHPPFAEEARRRARELPGSGGTQYVSSLHELRNACAAREWDVLLAFGTGVVVPADLLAGPRLQAFNIHAASPAFPGRDPHHFAAYEGVREYGATLHRMTAVVDQGPVMAVDLVPVPHGATPHQLLQLGNECGLRLMHAFLAQLARGSVPVPDPSLRWSGPVRRRRDFEALCRIDAGMAAVEFDRRLHACAMPGYANLWTEIHGRRFVLDGSK